MEPPVHCIDITALHQCRGRVICEVAALREPVRQAGVRYGHVPVPIGVLCHCDGITNNVHSIAFTACLQRCPTGSPLLFPGEASQLEIFTSTSTVVPHAQLVDGHLRLSIGEQASNIPSGLILPSTESPPVMRRTRSTALCPKAASAL